MFFGFFPLFIQSTIFGVDIGFEYIKVSVVYPDSTIKSALNQQSKRLSPAYFAFWNKSNPRTFSLNQISNSDSHIDSRTLQQMNWAFFDSAKTHSQRFPQNGFKGLISNILENDFHGLNGREVFALVIRRLISTIDDGKYNPDEASVVISIDPSVSRITRYAIADALKIANIHLISIIDSSTSVATLYAQEKKSFFYGTSKNVLFYDMGSNSSWAGVYKFSMPLNDQNQRVIPIVEEFSVVSDENLGGNRMDEILANHLMSQYFKKEKCPYSNKIRQIFINEAKRAKEILTTDKSTTVRIDDIPGYDHGMNYVLTRDEFEGLISEMEGSISTLFTTTLKKANLSPDEIDSIELIGGPTRVPFVSKALMKASGMTKLNRTMNSDEAVSIGAGYVGLSKAIHNTNINFKPLSGINVSLYKDDQFIKQIFSEESRLDGIVSIQLKAQDLLPNKANEATTLSIVVNNTDRLSSFTFSNQIDVLNQYIRSKDDSVTLVFHFNKASVPSLYQTYIGTDLNTKLEPKYYYPVWKMNDDEIDYSSQFVKYMENIMKERQYLDKIKNDYESLIYQLKNLVQNNETFRNIVAERSIAYLEDQIVKHESWLENENEYGLEDYQEKYNQLKNLLEKALSLRPRNHQRYHQPRQEYSRPQRMFNRRRGLFPFGSSPFFILNRRRESSPVVERRSLTEDLPPIPEESAAIPFRLPDPQNVIRSKVDYSKWSHFYAGRKFWEYLVFTVTLSVPVEITFLLLFDRHFTSPAYIIYIVFDVIQIIDNFIILKTPYFENGMLVYDKKKILHNYGIANYIVHVIGSIPLSWISFVTRDFVLYCIFTSNQLLRLYQCYTVHRFIQNSMIYQGTFQKTYPYAIFFLVVVHIYACIFFGVAKIEGLSNSWIRDFVPCNYTEPQLYLVSYYFTLTTMFTIGYGYIHPVTLTEQILTIFLSFNGVVYQGFIISKIYALLLNPAQSLFIQNATQLLDYVRSKKGNEFYLQYVADYIQFMWDKRHGALTYKAILKMLPESLRSRLKLEQINRCFSDNPLFYGMNSTFFLRLMEAMNPITFIPGEIVYQQGDHNSNLYIFECGIIQYLSNGQPYVTQDTGDNFIDGIKEILFNTERSQSMISRSFMEGWKLTRADFCRVLSLDQFWRTQLYFNVRQLYPTEVEQTHLTAENLLVLEGDENENLNPSRINQGLVNLDSLDETEESSSSSSSTEFFDI